MPTEFEDFIQIAGIKDMDEANQLIRCGIRYLGFPLRLPVNEPDVSEADAADIIQRMQPRAVGVLITYLNDADDIVQLLNALGASVVQLHGDVEAGELERVRRLRPEVRIIKSLVVGQQEHQQLFSRVHDLGELVDAFITDTFDPATGASGATGKTHDWRVSRRLVEISRRPVIRRCLGFPTAHQSHRAVV